jgi:hypothetical protein
LKGKAERLKLILPAMQNLLLKEEVRFDFEAIITKLKKLQLDEVELREKINSSQEWSDSEKSDLRNFLDKKLEMRRANDQRLEAVRELGHGSYGTVSRVRHIETRIEMAKKTVTLPSNNNANKQARAAMKGLKIELNVLYKSFSPHVIGFYDSYKVGTDCCLLIELMELGSFMSVLEKQTYRIPGHVLAKLAESVISCLKEFLNMLRLVI